MALVDLHLPPDPTLPSDVRAFLREAGRRVARFQREQPKPAFVPSDFLAAYAALRRWKRPALHRAAPSASGGAASEWCPAWPRC